MELLFVLPNPAQETTHTHTNLFLLPLPLILTSILHKSDYTEFNGVLLYISVKFLDVHDHVLIHVYNLYCAYYVPGYMFKGASHTIPCLILQ